MGDVWTLRIASLRNTAMPSQWVWDACVYILHFVTAALGSIFAIVVHEAGERNASLNIEVCIFWPQMLMWCKEDEELTYVMLLVLSFRFGPGYSLKRRKRFFLGMKTKLNARMVIRQRADLFEVIVFPFSVALARRKFNFVSRNIGLEWISPLPPCTQFCFNSLFKWRLALASLH